MSQKKNKLLKDAQEQAQLARAASANASTVALFHAQQFSGPMPPPAMLREYDEVLPGLANRIVTMAENQSKHRIKLESRVTTSNIWRGHLGQIFAFLIAIAGIIAGTYLILQDKPVEGLAAIIGPIAGIAGVFIWGKRKQTQELASKDRAIR